MFDFLFLKYETTLIATIIGGIIGFFILITAKRFTQFLIRKNPINFIGKIYDEIECTISVLYDAIRGFRYYSTDEFADKKMLKQGSMIRIAKQDFPNNPKLLPSDSNVGNLATVLSVGYINPYKDWVLLRVLTYKHTS